MTCAGIFHGITSKALHTWDEFAIKAVNPAGIIRTNRKRREPRYLSMRNKRGFRNYFGRQPKIASLPLCDKNLTNPNILHCK